MMTDLRAHNASAQPFRAVLFDLGSTLIYFEGDFEAVIRRANRSMLAALRREGFTLGADFLEDFHTSMQEYLDRREADMVEYTTASILEETLRRHGQTDIHARQIREALQARYAVTQEHWHLEEDAIPTLAELRRRGCRMGVLSNAGDDDDVQKLVQISGIQEYFDFVLSSAALGIRKPHVEAFQAALGRWPFAPEEVLMVGDTLEADILGAQKSGMPNLWITRRAFSLADPDHGVQPDASISTLTELLAYCPQPNT